MAGDSTQKTLTVPNKIHTAILCRTGLGLSLPLSLNNIQETAEPVDYY